jgi:hypothetical protein
MKEKFSNQLSAAEIERLALLGEEMGEAQQAIGKVLRHGYQSYNPVLNTGLVNRRELERELGHVSAAVTLLTRAGDVNLKGMRFSMLDKIKNLRRWLHHQPRKLLR